MKRSELVVVAGRVFGCLAVLRLLRAGARIPTHPENPLPPYLDKVRRAGGFVPYERAHRTRLAAIFVPKFPGLPVEVIHHIVSIWADCGGH